MYCPVCKNKRINHIETCPKCGFKYKPIKWVVITKEYPPNDMIIESLLKSASIPVKLFKRAVSGFPVAIGPLAEVEILVPENRAKDANIIINDINNDYPDTTLSEDE